MQKQRHHGRQCGTDARSPSLWIAFNAAHADEREVQSIAPSERAAYKGYFDRIDRLDRNRRIYGALWQRFSGPVRTLMNNRYVFNPFWQHRKRGFLPIGTALAEVRAGRDVEGSIAV